MNGNGYLTRKMFYWVMGVLIMAFTTIMGYTIGNVDKVEEKFNHNFTTITNSISSVETSIEFMKDDIRDIKDTLKDTLKDTRKF